MAKRSPWTNEDYAVLHAAMSEMNVWTYVDSEYERTIRNFGKNIVTIAEKLNRTPRAICDKMAERYSEREIRSFEKVHEGEESASERVFSTLHRSVEHRLYKLYQSCEDKTVNRAFSKRIDSIVAATKNINSFIEKEVNRKTNTKLSKEDVDMVKGSWKVTRLPTISSVTARTLISVAQHTKTPSAYRKR